MEYQKINHNTMPTNPFVAACLLISKGYHNSIFLKAIDAWYLWHRLVAQHLHQAYEKWNSENVPGKDYPTPL